MRALFSQVTYCIHSLFSTASANYQRGRISTEPDIQNAFEAGAEYDHHATGESLSVTEAILDELSGFGVFTESELASRLHLDEAVVLEQLYELRSQGRVDGSDGAWTRDFEHGELPEPDDEYIF